MILTDRKERNRFVKFAIVGAFGALLDFGVMNLLSNVAHMRLVFAGSISFLCAVMSNFFWNRYWTYPESRSRHLLHQLGMFFLVNLAGIAIRIPILHFGEPPLLQLLRGSFSVSGDAAEFLAKNLTLATAVALVMLWNYFVNRYWTYNDIEDS
jgi:putative flippase GtrA